MQDWSETGLKVCLIPNILSAENQKVSTPVVRESTSGWQSNDLHSWPFTLLVSVTPQCH